MDPTAQNTTTVVQTDNVVDTPFPAPVGAATPPPNTTTTVSTTSFTPPSGGGAKKTIITVLGLVVVVGGLIASALLVQNQQLINQRAAPGDVCQVGNIQCIPDHLVSCTPDKKCRYIAGEHGFAKQNCSTCPSGYTDAGGACLVAFGGDRNCTVGPEGGNVTAGMRCDADTEAYCAGQPSATPPPGGGSCQSGWCTTQSECTANPGAQWGGANDGYCQPSTLGQCCLAGTTAPTPTPRKPICGETCTQDLDCALSSAGTSFQPVCYQGKCANPLCKDDTLFGSICSCGSKNVRECGQLCGAQPNGQTFSANCGPNAICGNQTNGGDGFNYCLPTNNPSYTTKGGICALDKNPGLFCINKLDGTPLKTQAEIIQACNVVPTTLACLNIKAYDINWAQLTAQQLSALTPGTVVRFSVSGSKTSGTFDKARFTINGVLRPEVTRTVNAEEFYDEYTIPAGITSFTVNAQIHHAQSNTWN